MATLVVEPVPDSVVEPVPEVPAKSTKPFQCAHEGCTKAYSNARRLRRR